jgi:hypothetical protein
MPNRMSEIMPEYRTSEFMPDRMSKKMSDRMLEYLSDRMSFGVDHLKKVISVLWKPVESMNKRMEMDQNLLNTMFAGMSIHKITVGIQWYSCFLGVHQMFPRVLTCFDPYPYEYR